MAPRVPRRARLAGGEAVRICFQVRLSGTGCCLAPARALERPEPSHHGLLRERRSRIARQQVLQAHERLVEIAAAFGFDRGLEQKILLVERTLSSIRQCVLLGR
jgi:hypothetical protein